MHKGTVQAAAYSTPSATLTEALFTTVVERKVLDHQQRGLLVAQH